MEAKVSRVDWCTLISILKLEARKTIGVFQERNQSVF